MLPLRALPQELDKLARKYRPGNYSRALQQVDSYLIVRVQESFRTRTSPGGARWAGDADLVQTGGLLAAATAAGDIAEGQLTRRTKHPLSHIHQMGTKKGGKKRVKKSKAASPLGAAKLIKRLKKAAAMVKAVVEGDVAAGIGMLAQALMRKPARRGRKRKNQRRRGAFRIPPRPWEGIAPKDADRIAAIVANDAVRGR